MKVTSFSYSRFAEETAIFADPQASATCPSEDSIVKMSIQHWWNDTGTGKPTYSEKDLSQCHPAYNKSKANGPGSE